MRKAVLIVFLALGAGFGWLLTLEKDAGTQLVLIAVGAMFGGAIGGGLSRIGAPPAQQNWQGATEEDLEPIPGLGTTSKDLAANFWRDEGHLPFMKPPRAELGSHMFDADKNS